MFKLIAVKFKNSATLIVMFSTLLARILGYLKFALVAKYFGGSGQADVINAVFSIPNNLRKLMAEGALTTAFIPTLSKHVVAEDKEAARRLTQRVLTLQYSVLIPFIVVSILSAPNMIKIFVNFSSLEKMLLSATLYAWFVPYVLFVSVGAIMMAVFNTHGKFLLSALSPLLFSIIVIISIIMFNSYLGVYSMVLGILGGGLGQIIIQYPLFHSLEYSWTPNFDFKDKEFRIVLKRYTPALITSSIFAINQQIAMYLASGLMDGSTSALSNAIIFFQLPFGIFSAAVNTVFYPQLAKAAQSSERTDLAEILKKGLHVLFIFLAPSALLMSLLSHEIVSIALMRGKFTLEAVIMTSSTLVGFLIGIFFIAAYNFSQRYFYAKGYFILPLITAIIACSLDVVLSVVFIKMSFGVVGLAYANSIAFFLGFLILMSIIRRQQRHFKYRDSFILFIKVLISLGAGYMSYYVIRLHLGSTWWQEGDVFWRNLGLLFIQGGLPAIVILLLYILLRVKFLQDSSEALVSS